MIEGRLPWAAFESTLCDDGCETPDVGHRVAPGLSGPAICWLAKEDGTASYG
jgi:hypothetical protein